jgi:hypothetical protein
LTWLGTAEQYLAQLKVMHRAVKEADPAAMVVLGGATYALPASAADSAERQFYTIVLGDGRDAFDVFDLHLYGPAEQILTDIEGARSMMLAFGYQKPLLVGEYNAPWPNLYPEALAAMEETMAAVEGGGDPRRTPEEAAIANLYERMVNLPLELQMFMRGCPPELDAKRDRINCREIVMRNLLALSAGYPVRCAGISRLRFRVMRIGCQSWICCSASSRFWTMAAASCGSGIPQLIRSRCWPSSSLVSRA